MLIKTKYIDCASKSVFNTWKLPTSAADTSGDIYWSAIVCIQDTGEVWTHGKLYGGFFSNADSNKVSLTIGGTTKILALDGHVQSYTTLTGSGTTADQAILSTGVANKWTLKTLGKNAFSNVDYLPADATAVAAEKVVNAMRFQYNGKDMHSFDGSVARLLNIIQGDNVFITGDSQGNVTIAADPGSDTVNTAGATNLIDKKLFLIGAESQTTSPQTYSNQYVYIGTDNCLYSLGKKVLTEHQAIYNLDLQTQVGDAVTKVTTFDPNAANNSFTLVQGTNVTLIPDATNKKVTISSKDTTYDFYNLIFKQGDTVVDTYKPTTSPNKSFKAGTNVTFAKSGDEITVTTQDTRNTAGATEKLATKLFLTGSLTQTDNPQTYTNSKVYIGADNKLYSDGKVVSTGDHTHNYAGATTPGGPALKVDLNPSGLLDATYGSYGGILQDSNNGPETGSWSNRIKILHNNSSGYYTELAQAMTGTAGLWHRRNVAGVVSDWTPVIDKANFRTYLDATYVIRGNDPNVLTKYVRYSIASGLTMNWEMGNATPTHIWGAKGNDSSKAYVFNGGNIRAFANAVNRAGDTMTGSLTINSSGSFPSLTLSNKDYQATKCQIGGGLNGDFILRNVTGDTSTDLRFNNESLRYKGSMVWHAGNDGSGSGLDADLLDSYHETAFPRLVGIKNGTWNWNDVIRAGYYKIQAGTVTNHPTGVYQYGMAEVITTENHADGENRELQIYYPHDTSDNIGIWIRMHNSATQGNGWGAWKGIPTTTWADNKFLPLAGGTMTGAITMPKNIQIRWIDNKSTIYGDGSNILMSAPNSLKFNNNVVLHSGNYYNLIKDNALVHLGIYSTFYAYNTLDQQYVSFGMNATSNYFGSPNVKTTIRSSQEIDFVKGTSTYKLIHSGIKDYAILYDGSNGTSASVSKLLNFLTTSSSTPIDTDYFISQYAGGGTTTTTFHRRPVSALFEYIKGKTNRLYLSQGTTTVSGIPTIRHPNYNGISLVRTVDQGSSILYSNINRTFGDIGFDSGNYFSVRNAQQTNILCVTQGGNMGLGTTAPAYKLHVEGNVRINDTLIGASTLKLVGASSEIHLKCQNNDRMAVVLSSSQFKPFNSAANLLDLGYSSARWARLYANSGDFSGAVGIGAATPTSARLYVVGQTILHGNVVARSAASGSSGGDISFELYRGSNASWKLLNSGGNLYFQSNYTSGVTSYFNTFYLTCNSGNVWSKGTMSASGFIKSSSSNSYILLGGGGHMAISDFNGKFLPITGGTVTGTTTISTSSFGALYINKSGSSNGASIGFKNSNVTLGYIGMTLGVNSGLVRWSADTTKAYTVIDTGNMSSYLTWSNISGKPSSFTPSSHKQAYTAAECTSYNSDSNTLGTTPAAVKKAVRKAVLPGEVIDFYVYRVGSYYATTTDYTTFKNQLFNSNGRGKSSVTYYATYSNQYTVDLSDFVLCSGNMSGYSNGAYMAGAGEIEGNRVGSTAGSNSKTISGLEMPKHAHWFGRYRSDNANDRDVFGPDGGQNHSTNGTTSAGQGGNWRTGYSGSGASKDWRPKTVFVFKLIYAPQS